MRRGNELERVIDRTEGPALTGAEAGESVLSEQAGAVGVEGARSQVGAARVDNPLECAFLFGWPDRRPRGNGADHQSELGG